VGIEKFYCDLGKIVSAIMLGFLVMLYCYPQRVSLPELLESLSIYLIATGLYLLFWLGVWSWLRRSKNG